MLFFYFKKKIFLLIVVSFWLESWQVAEIQVSRGVMTLNRFQNNNPQMLGRYS